jgi:multidrug efflux pump subunit AcrA (membrane-fusion protein)
MSWRKITFIIVALIVLLGGSAALSYLFVSMKPEPPRRPEMELVRYVKAEPISYEEITSSVMREGRVVSGSEVMLVSEAAGKIEKGSVELRKGASFKKGQLIAQIYKDEIELALKARKSKFLTLMTTLLPDVKVDYPESLPAFEGFFNEIKLDEPLPELPEVKDNKLKIFLASRNVLSEYYGIQQDELRLSRHTLYAPFNGSFTMVNYEVGSYVNTGAQIARMIHTDQLEIEVPVPNGQSRWIKIGDKVKVHSQNRKATREGVVVRKADFIDHNTQSRSIFVEVRSTARDELLAGEYKLVEFPGQLINNAMEIPRSAVFNTNEVFTVVDGKLKKEEIEIIKINEKTLIFNGLPEGGRIVVEPLINAKENTAVGILGEEHPQNEGEKRKGNKSSKS